MATVINDLVNSKNSDRTIKFTHIISHVEGSLFEKGLISFKALGNVIQKADYDILHIHCASDVSFYRKSLFVLLGKILQKKIVFHVHGGDFDKFYYQSSSVAQSYIRKIFSSCDRVIVLSKYWEHFFQKIIPGKQVDVLHNGVYAEDFSSCQTAPENIHKFLFMGRLTRDKGVYDLLEAVNKLVNQHQYRSLRFYLAGNGETDKVIDYLKQHNLTENVKLLGWIDEKEKVEWLSKTDTLLLPSYLEGLPMCIIEAMAAGKIIVSTNVGGIPDLIKENENGFLINPGDVEDLVAKIMHVIDHPENMLTISDNNRKKIALSYDLPTIHNCLFDMYHNLATLAPVYENDEVKYKQAITQPAD
jgi:glycosyltransferase involved in cell wall biosynthesis